MCMKKHPIPSGKLSDLPKNLLIEKMLQTLENRKAMTIIHAGSVWVTHTKEEIRNEFQP